MTAAPLSPYIPFTGAPTTMPTPTAFRLAGGISAYLAPRIGGDAKLPAILPMVRDISRKNFGAKKNQIASRIRYGMRGRIAQDADLDDLMDLLDALEEIGESEAIEAEGGEDRYRRRGRDQEPNDPFGGGAYEAGGINPNVLTTPADATCPSDWDDEPADGYWREEDNEERRREGIANSTGSEAIDRRIAMNRDRQRKVADNRRAVIDKMRRVVRDAMSAGDPEVPGHNTNVTQSSALDPTAEPVDSRAMDRRLATDAALSARGRMLANMGRIGHGAVAYCPASAGGSSPAIGDGSQASFTQRYPWASRIRIG